MFKKLTISTGLLFFILGIPVQAQDVGLPFLRIGVGARQVGMGSAFTGVGDDTYTMYWNPGGLGHLRRWQWSVSYNRWFTDVYQTSLSYVKQFRMLGSQKTAFGISGLYLGMPYWDSTRGDKGIDPVTANHFVGNLAFGQRLDWLSKSLSLGVNIKYIQSDLAGFSASGIATDMGVLFRPQRFELGSAGLGIFDYGIFSCGFSISHLGTSMKFETESTSLPQTGRGGMSLRFGRYRAFSVLLAVDVIRVKDRDAITGLGSELWWKNLLGARMGYMVNGDDLGGFSFGFGLRWNDVLRGFLGLPSRYGDAFELDFADVGYGEVLQETYRGAVSHYSVAPEPFKMDIPFVVNSFDMREASAVTLFWEEAFDPDPYDEIGYILLFDKDETRVNRAIRHLGNNMDDFLASALRDSLLKCEFVNGTTYVDSVEEGGVYHWAVAAYDLAHHVRLAKRGREEIGTFIVRVPDLMVPLIAFSPTQWITSTPEQGKLTFHVMNAGSGHADDVEFTAQDMFPSDTHFGDTILFTTIKHLDVGEDTILTIDWNADESGLHRIKAMVDPQSLILELDEENNITSEYFITIPKGRVFAKDTVEVMATGFDSTEIPVVPEIYFMSHSSDLNPFYYSDEEALPPVLLTFAERMQDNAQVELQIFGSIDALSGEQDPALADARAEQVQDMLMELGVPGSRLSIVEDHPDKVLGQRRMPVDSMDAIWVMQQNRRVAFSVEQMYEEAIFGPYRVGVDTTLKEDSVFVNVQVISPGGFMEWALTIEPRSILVAGDEPVEGTRLWEKYLWNGMDSNHIVVPLDHYYKYHFALTDTLGRLFHTPVDSIFLQEKRTIRRQEVFGAAKFAQVEPVYQFYWDRIMEIAEEMYNDPALHLRFEGHACVVGPEGVNQRLSFRRAKRFTDAFLERIRLTYPQQYQRFRNRVAEPLGYGERQPLNIRLKDHGMVYLGNNQSPVGRYLNRRIMVLLYREQ